MTEPFPTPQQYLEVLAELEASAAPSEAAYYQKVRAKYEALASKTPAAPVDDEGPEALARDLDMGYEGLYFLHYELAKPDLDHHWRTWLEGRIPRYESSIEQIRSKLEQQQYTYVPPPNSLEKLMEEEAQEKVQSRITELEMFRALKVAWAERNSRLAEVAAEVQVLDEELRQLKKQA